MEKSFINNIDISDALIERPICFSVRGKRFSVFHPSLGKIHLISRLTEAIGLGEDRRGLDIYASCFVAAKQKRDGCLRIIAYSTLPGKECLDEEKVRKQLRALRHLDRRDVATLLATIIGLDKSDAIMKHFGIDGETKRLSQAVKAKDSDKSALDFCGKSVWGMLVDPACERYGWPFDYVVWGISFCNLQLLLADHVKTLYLSEEERKRCRVSTDKQVIRADDTASLEQFIKTHNWK